MLVDILKKTFKIIRNMFTEDTIATAQIAQLFGSELLKVQQNATTDSGSQPDIVRIDPKQFLTRDARYQSAKKADEQRLIQMLQKEAEAAYPSPEASSVPIQPPIQQLPSVNAQMSKPNVLDSPVTIKIPQQSDTLERIALSLERIAVKLESVDVSIKKKRIKRSIK